MLVTVHISRDPEAVTGARFSRDFAVESNPVRRARVAVWDDRAPRVPGDGWGIWMRPVWTTGDWGGEDPCAGAHGEVHGPAAVLTVVPEGSASLSVPAGCLTGVLMAGDGYSAQLSVWASLDEARRHCPVTTGGWSAHFAALGWSGTL